MNLLPRIVKKSVKKMLKNSGYELFRKYYYDFNANDSLVKIVNEKFNNKKDLIIFDVGANVGQTVDRFYSIFPDAKIYSFEPNQIAFEKLVKKEKQYSNFKAINKGLASSIEKRVFYKQPDSGSSSFLKLNIENEEFRLSQTDEAKLNHNITTVKEELEYNSEIIVETETIDNFCKNNGITEINILKIDTQGYETEVLGGAKNMLSQVGIIECEIILGNTYEKSSAFYNIESLINGDGFILWDIPYIGKFATDSINRINFLDAIFVNNKMKGKQ